MNPFDIMKASQMACCLEVSSFKPGNVHRTRDYHDIKYHHFITSGIAFGNAIYSVSNRFKDLDVSIKLNSNSNSNSDLKESNNFQINVGKAIKEAVIESVKWSPSNANLGIIMLHTPIAMAASKLGEFNLEDLKKWTEYITSNTTVNDAIAVYEAIEIGMAYVNPPEEGPDVKNDDSKKELVEKNLNLYDVYNISKEWDTISKEWVSNFKISYEGYELLKNNYEKNNEIHEAVTLTFLEILSKYPDTLIARKKGIEVSKLVSEKAKETLENFKKTGNRTVILDFDTYLSQESNKLNPGTTADLMASALFIYLIDRILSNKTILL
ncbi:triphosphoribosyl-dephospho-CoA synthase [Methanococcus voltae]|uniref:Triphosphoribosyl-dephospho-CoA synthase n=2 Tax=Methanococcus voltae TaxID=2188 RepID=A0A8J7S589_METVO|nr:triphosphoribosyl-dephospho-CoA synthase [Methanococcus voltae]MBP2172825.1 triphosphoribosyl-dephospho-CoA synthase [Methanococcus voltae]MBP2201765.1 triphosphoribosyl-dephospho-CoA synthase [Methanococcus voltae]MCS3922553.1 triphosphoribosyl-dephospho-CoA synthase [Methanococcus voltae PS]